MNRLEQLYEKYGTDKGLTSFFPEEVSKGHEYGLFYYDYFKSYLDKNPTMLEIGVFEGKSMLAHNEFFNSKCTLVGIDADNFISFDVSKYPNMHFYFDGSEADTTLNAMNDYKFDIIMDDAIHTYDNQLFNLLYYPQFLKEDGIYILEDLQCNIDNMYLTNPEYGLLNSTFDVLFRKNKSSLLSDEQYRQISNSIDTIVLWSKTLDPDNFYKSNQVSMTAVIKFKH